MSMSDEDKQSLKELLYAALEQVEYDNPDLTVTLETVLERAKELMPDAPESANEDDSLSCGF